MDGREAEGAAPDVDECRGGEEGGGEEEAPGAGGEGEGGGERGEGEDARVGEASCVFSLFFRLLVGGFAEASLTARTTPSFSLWRETEKLEQEYTATWRRFVWLEHRMYASLLATADVFLATTMGSGPSKASSVSRLPFFSRATISGERANFPRVLSSL